MNYFWLISNCILFFCFRLSLLLYLSFVVVLLLPCSLLYTFNFCYNMCPQLCSVSSFFLYFIFIVLMIFFLFFLFFSILSSDIFYCWRWCSPVPPQSSIQVRPAIHLLRPFLSFSIYPPSFFSSCFLFWHGYSAIRTNDLIELGWCFWGFVLFVDKIYDFFYVLPFFDIIFQLLNLYPYILNHLFVT